MMMRCGRAWRGAVVLRGVGAVRGDVDGQGARRVEACGEMRCAAAAVKLAVECCSSAKRRCLRVEKGAGERRDFCGSGRRGGTRLAAVGVVWCGVVRGCA